MTRYQQTTWLGCVAVVFLGGCASARMNRNLDAKLASESVSLRRVDLDAQASQLIDGMSALSLEKRASLIALKESVRSELDRDTEHSLQLRSVLMKDVISLADNTEEVEVIKQRLRKVENARLTTLFNAIDQANAVLGKQRDAAGDFFNDFLFHDFASGPQVERR